MPTMVLPHWKLIVFGFVAGFLGMAPFGFHNSVVDVPEDIFRAFENGSFYWHYGKYLGGYESASLWSFTTAILQVGACIGALSVAYVTTRYGRRRSFFILVSVTAFAGSVLMGGAFPAKSFEMIIVGRFLMGISGGLASGSLGVYFTEVSPVRFRGIIGANQALLAKVGVLAGSILPLPPVLGPYMTTPYVIALTAISAILLLLMLPVFPESPKFLYLTLRKQEEATRSLRFYHGPRVDAKKVFAGYERETALVRAQLTTSEIFSNRNLRWPVLLGVICNFASMDTGLTAIVSYSVSMFDQVGISKSWSDYGTVVMLTCSFAGNIFAVPLMRIMKRRHMFLGGIVVCMFCLTAFAVLNQVLVSYQSHHWSKGLAYVCLAAIVLHMTIYSLTTGSVIWFLAAEMTPQPARSVASSLSITTAFVTSVVTTQLFLELDKAINAWSVMVLFVGPSILSFAFLYRYLPETKDRSVDQIMETWWRDSIPKVDPEDHFTPSTERF